MTTEQPTYAFVPAPLLVMVIANQGLAGKTLEITMEAATLVGGKTLDPHNFVIRLGMAVYNLAKKSPIACLIDLLDFLRENFNQIAALLIPDEAFLRAVVAEHELHVEVFQLKSGLLAAALENINSGDYHLIYKISASQDEQ